MTQQQMEEKLTEIYHEFGKTIGEHETDESVVARAKDWFKWRLRQETDVEETIEDIATQLANMVAQAAEINKNNKMSKEKVWMITGSTYSQVDPGFKIEPTLSTGVYNLELTMFGWKLFKFADNFVFPYKLYNLENNFIDHVIKTYDNTIGNLGILLNGTKGTGKTVTAKVLANKLNLPVIVLKNMGDNNQSMIEYLSTLNCNCVLFMDEFEKDFNEEDSTILKIMDGVYNSNHRKIFLLTTNNMHINENLVGRPSRIRYVKHFGNLSMDTVNEYLDDALECTEAREEILEFIDSLTISTIDILKTIVNEVNIHGMEGLRRAKNYFNVQTNEYHYSCLRGHCGDNEYGQNPEKYSIDSFVTAVERYMNPIPKPIVNDEDNCTPEERAKLNEYYAYRQHNFHYFNYEYVFSNVKFSALKPGDSFNEEGVIAVDTKKNVIITKDYDNFKYYYIKDPNSKPSLYGKNLPYVF